MRLVRAPKVTVVEEDERVAGEDEGGAVVSSHRDTTYRIQSYNISPNEWMERDSLFARPSSISFPPLLGVINNQSPTRNQPSSLIASAVA
jgi:hypothetical protein